MIYDVNTQILYPCSRLLLLPKLPCASAETFSIAVAAVVGFHSQQTSIILLQLSSIQNRAEHLAYSYLACVRSLQRQ